MLSSGTVPAHAEGEASSRRGYVLIALSVALVFLLGMAGLAVDIGRMYTTKSEAQSYVDSAALAAALQLDGTSAGITRANTAVSNSPKQWEFQTNAFTGTTTTFATSSSGPWVAAPNPATGYYFVQVLTTVNLPMYLMGPLAGRQSTIAALAVAGHAASTSVPGGEFPFSPYTRQATPDDGSDPFGYRVGNQYTLRWGAPGTQTSCGTDAVEANLSTQGKIRGYCCAANSASSIRAAILGQTVPLSISPGATVPMDNGAKNTEMSTIADRVNQDTDTTSTTYAQYLLRGWGNGRRVVFVPVNGGAPSYPLIGFAGFFLLTPDSYSGLRGNQSACGEYTGRYVHGATGSAPGGSGAYHIKLYQ